jgi:predicted alpha/beta superfamily hydrolase
MPLPMHNLIALMVLLTSPPLTKADYRVDTLVVASVILNEPRNIVIYQPAGYQKTDSVTIVYLLDGEFSRCRYDKISLEYSGRPVIGIGIINTDRNRDLLPAKQPEPFLSFIEKELIPAIEKNYNLAGRILFGHSFAGAFTLYAMIQRPGLFDKYIASSPTPIMNMVDTSIYLHLDNQLNKSTAFYFSFGTKDMKQVIKWCMVLNNNLQPLNFKHIHWIHEVNEGENHNTNDMVSLMKVFQAF